MKWRPASEKPAKLLENYYCKVYRDIIKQGWKKTVLITLDGSWQTEDTVIEWLDESESPTTADASVLVEALEEITRLHEAKGRKGCTWGDTDYDSLSAVAGYNDGLGIAKGISETALAQYSTQSPSSIEESGLKEGEDKNLGTCVECKKRKAVRDYNGHGHFVCNPCYDSLSNEFEDEYR